ncbi:hypothetical protein ACROYT_G015166 [Oculina patagonica]
MAEQKPSEDIHPLNTSDKRFMTLRSALDTEMKDATRTGVALQNKKAEKLPVTQEEENKFWEMGLLGYEADDQDLSADVDEVVKTSKKTAKKKVLKKKENKKESKADKNPKKNRSSTI